MSQRSLKKKLITRNSITLFLAFVAFMAGLIQLNYSHYNEQQRRVTERAEAKLYTRGEVLVRDKGIMLPDDVAFLRFEKIGDIVENNAQTVEEIAYGGFLDAQSSIWAWVTVEGFGEERNIETMELDRLNPKYMRTDTSEWALGLKEYTMRRHPEKADIIEFATPVFLREADDPDSSADSGKTFAGVIIYGLSTQPMMREIAQQSDAFAANQRDTLLVMSLVGLLGLVFGFVVMLRQAAHITQPLGTLTNAADAIAAGSHDKVKAVEQIRSGDELQTLALSFAQMAHDIKARGEELRAKNLELEEAKAQLEDLNKHLEEKFEERNRQLKDSESKFRTLFEASADAILVRTRERFLDCNAALLAMLGFASKQAFLQMQPNDLTLADIPEEWEITGNLDDYFTLAETEGSQHFDWAWQRMDGERFPIEMVITSFILNGQSVMHMVLRDTTERKATQEALKLAEAKLVGTAMATAHSAGMADMATGVLHNIGNLLNSVNISIEEIVGSLKSSKLKGFIKANKMVSRNRDNLGTFFTEHPKGKLIPDYFRSLGEAMAEEQDNMKVEIDELCEKVAMMRDVISTQQNYAKTTLYTEDIMVQDILEDTLKLQMTSLKKQGVKVIRQYNTNPRGALPKVKLVHVLTNLIKNSKEAMFDNDRHNKPQELHLILNDLPEDCVEVLVIDNGCGIKDENIDKIFSHGFTTKLNGHGFGLHTCANLMAEMGGKLSVESEGEGKGSRFIMRFPLECPVHGDEEEESHVG